MLLQLIMLIESYNIDIQYRQHLAVPKIYGYHYTTALQLIYIHRRKHRGDAGDALFVIRYYVIRPPRF